jgi:hypothetical protein
MPYDGARLQPKVFHCILKLKYKNKKKFWNTRVKLLYVNQKKLSSKKIYQDRIAEDVFDLEKKFT